jgi:hypothetical protein
MLNDGYAWDRPMDQRLRKLELGSSIAYRAALKAMVKQDVLIDDRAARNNPMPDQNNKSAAARTKRCSIAE